MNVTPQVQALVMKKLVECRDKVEAHYNRAIPMPTIGYDVTGTTAGFANYVHNHIRFNGGLLMANLDAFIERTVPHEFAHIACDTLYPEAHRPLRPVFSTKRVKREVHGPRFREIMAVMGAEDDSRCHNYDTSTTAKPKSKYKYECVSCKREYAVGPKIHNAIHTNQGRTYTCRCGGKLAMIQELGKVSYTQAKQIMAGEIPPAPVDPKKTTSLKAPVYGTKLYRCWELYQSYCNSEDRAGMINLFVMEAGCTYAGASTYHATCKKLYQANVY